jgi:hypothetical protein
VIYLLYREFWVREDPNISLRFAIKSWRMT